MKINFLFFNNLFSVFIFLTFYIHNSVFFLKIFFFLFKQENVKYQGHICHFIYTDFIWHKKKTSYIDIRIKYWKHFPSFINMIFISPPNLFHIFIFYAINHKQLLQTYFCLTFSFNLICPKIHFLMKLPTAKKKKFTKPCC